MHIVTKAPRLLAFIFLFTLSACGGGGGGGGGGGPSLSLSTNSLTFDATGTSFTPAPQTVSVTINGSVSGTLYILAVSTGPAIGSISNVTITGPTTGQADVFPASAITLGPGTYSSTITVTACTSGPTCSSGVIGTPQTIHVTYNVRWPSGSVGSSCSGSTTSTGASGSLDTHFCGTGQLVFDSIFRAVGDDESNAIALESSGNILIGGYTHNADGNFDTAVWRYSPTGAVDTNFGVDYDGNGTKEGFVTYDNATGIYRSDVINAITVDGSGRILVAGRTDNGQSTPDMIVMRYTSAGILDTTFASGGRFVHNGAAGGNLGDEARGIAVDSNGNIVVAGYSTNAAGNFDTVVWRLLGNGSLDTTFGGDYDSNGTKDGFVKHDNAAGGSANDFGNAVLIDGSGRILVAGSSSRNAALQTEDRDMVVWRFTSAGALDTTFGGDYDSNLTPDGFVLHDGATVAASYDSAAAFVLDGNQGIIVVGSSFSVSTDYKLIVWRLTPDGVLDTTFGGDYNSSGSPDGYVRWGTNGSWDSGRAVAVDASNRIIVAGGRSNDLVVLRYTPAGALDNSFGTGGATFFAHGAGKGVTLKPTGEIIVTGSFHNGNNYDMAIWQYVP